MRDKWYGDKRDVVKWGSIAALADRHSICSVLQIAFYRPDKTDFCFDGTTELLQPKVISYFRNLENIKGLAKILNLKIDVYKNTFRRLPEFQNEFQTNKEFREGYFKQVERIIKSYVESVIVFLDPDTGIAPQYYDFSHVTTDEIRQVFNAMKNKDILIFYQHARLGNGDWPKTTKAEFQNAVGDAIHVETFTCSEIAGDVAFFVAEKV